MTFTDEYAIKLLKGVNSEVLENWIEEEPEDEREGRTDIVVLFDELSYLLDCYAPNSGHVFSDVIRICRKKLRETCNGKVIPFDMETLKPKNGYSPDDIKAYKEEINEYNRLKRLYNKLLNKLYEMLEY